MDYRLLITDMDGTLLDCRREIPERNRGAVERLMAAGGLYTFATGRNEESTMPYATSLRVNAPTILYNGAKVVDLTSSETLFERHLDPEDAASVLAPLAPFDVSVLLHQGGRLYVGKADSRIRAHASKDRATFIETGDLLSFIQHGRPNRCSGRDDGARNPPPTKLLIIGEGQTLETIRQLLSAAFPSLALVCSEPEYLEVLPPGVSKGAALDALCRHLGLERKEVVAMGDAPNDIELLDAAGLGVAVGNAHPALKAHAAYVAPTNEECAVADVIRRFFGL